jgi:hypothetical protein
MVAFAAATGLRPSELFALEHDDVDRAPVSSRFDGRMRTGGSSTPRRG